MGEPWILAIDQGNGEPKVAAVSLGGRVLAGAPRPVSVHLGSDGAATQDASECLQQLTAAVRDLLAVVDPADCTLSPSPGKRGSTVLVANHGRTAGPVLLWAATRAAGSARRIVGGPGAGYSPAKDRVFWPEDTDRDEYQRLYAGDMRLYATLKGTYRRLNARV